MSVQSIPYTQRVVSKTGLFIGGYLLTTLSIRLIGIFISHVAGLGKCLVSVVVSPAGGEMNRLRKALSVKVSSLVTTNLPFDEWTDVFGSERLTGALLDRLTHQVHILKMNGDSYRLKGSRQDASASSAPEQAGP